MDLPNESVADPTAAAATSARGLALEVPPGELDPSFGNGGTSIANFGVNSDDLGRAVAVLPDGKIVVAGYTDVNGNQNDFGVWRGGSNGVSDPTFGNGGYSVANFGVISSDVGRAMAVQPDGKIVVAGHTNVNGNQDDFGVWRGGSNGASDPSFGNGGYSVANFGGTLDVGQAVAVQPDGKIVVAGYTDVNGNQNDFGVWRGGSNGVSDPSFGNGGYSVANFGVISSDVGRAMVVQPDGKIVVAGVTNVNGNQNDFGVWRGGSNGASDPSFGNGGYSTVNFGGSSDDLGHAVAVQPDGKIVVAGASNSNFAVARLQPNGLLDSTFGNGGTVRIPLGGNNDVVTAVALQPDGKIIFAGYSTVFGPFDFAVVRLTGDPGAGGGPGGPGGGGPPTCTGKPATIIGTQAADTLKGTAQKDVIVGLGGKDTIRALGGSDIVCAGSGNDKVFGGGAKDRLLGQRGNDLLRGGPVPTV